VLIDPHFQVQLNAWYQSLLENPSGVRSLADLIAFNDEHPDLEKPKGFESQNMWVYSQSNFFRCLPKFSAKA